MKRYRNQIAKDEVAETMLLDLSRVGTESVSSLGLIVNETGPLVIVLLVSCTKLISLAIHSKRFSRLISDIAPDSCHRFSKNTSSPRQALHCLPGLATDTRTLYQRLMFRHKLYQLREERDMKPETFASLVSSILYEKRFGPYFIQPVIAGLGDEDKPFICTMVRLFMFCICRELAKDFIAGTSSESLYGACEAMFKPDIYVICFHYSLSGASLSFLTNGSNSNNLLSVAQEPEDLFETVSQALLSSVDRDCPSGWGGHVYVVTPAEVKERILKGRMD
ncbi:hypothetical protein M0R45_004292 [Rubus argutus]|uniref:Uncharacterized protein n=1 Tax=Rubus argutus TaxID=59490 RepID=A0AAW1YJF8_RUBAR